MALLCSSVAVSYDRVTACTIYQDLETGAAKWNSAIINFVIYTCAFPVKISSVQKAYFPFLIFTFFYFNNCKLALNRKWNHSIYITHCCFISSFSKSDLSGLRLGC